MTSDALLPPLGSDAEIESVLVRLSSGSQHAWAESCPLGKPEYSSEYAVGSGRRYRSARVHPRPPL